MGIDEKRFCKEKAVACLIFLCVDAWDGLDSGIQPSVEWWLLDKYSISDDVIKSVLEFLSIDYESWRKSAFAITPIEVGVCLADLRNIQYNIEKAFYLDKEN